MSKDLIVNLGLFLNIDSLVLDAWTSIVCKVDGSFLWHGPPALLANDDESAFADEVSVSWIGSLAEERER